MAVTKSDIEAELQITLPDTYTDEQIAGYITYAEAQLRKLTHRLAFTGDAAYSADMYVLCAVIARLVTTNPDLVKTDIKSISENDSKIEFSVGSRSIKDYTNEAESILRSLALVSSGTNYSYTNEYTFYSSYS